MNHKTFLSIIIFAFLSPIPNAFAASDNANNINNTNNAHTDITTSSSSAKCCQAQKMQTDAIAIILQDHAQIRKMIAELNKTLDSDVAQSRSKFKDLKDFLVQ